MEKAGVTGKNNLPSAKKTCNGGQLRLKFDAEDNYGLCKHCVPMEESKPSGHPDL